MIENELKYVLDLNSETEVSKNAHRCCLITQGYLPSTSNLRIRKCVDKTVNYYFTFKLKDKDVIEIENEIEEREFDRLWKFTKNRLTKRRYIYSENLDETWDIDFFLSNGEVYFAMAEVEMLEGIKFPSSIPSFLKKNIVYSVPAENGKFSSKKLSSVKYANKLKKEFLNVQINR